MKTIFKFSFLKLSTSSVLLLLYIVLSCSRTNPKLPFLGDPVIKGTDTLFPKIKPFDFTDQNGKTISNATFKNKIYVADFIFLSCPTICPKMTIEMKKVHDIYRNNAAVLFLSHTIDPDRDTVEKLKVYASNLKVNENWHFVTGNKDSIFDVATNSYFTTAYKDAKEPGGYIHGGGLMLVDQNGYIRGVYDGTNAAETERLISDIKILLNELKG